MYQSKYGVARHIYIPVPKAGSANHAVGADWTPSAGDVKISKDGGAAANVTNLPTAIAMGNSAEWDFSLTATEMQAAQVMVIVSDSATKAVDDTGFSIETYGNASAQHLFDLAVATQKVDVDTIKTQAVTCAAGVTVLASVGTAATSTAQTGDTYARLGAPAGASHSADTAAVKVDTAAIKLKTDSLTFTDALKVDASLQVAADLKAAVANRIADHVLRRTNANALASADGDAKNFRSLAGATAKLVNKVAVVGTDLKTYETDDSTVLGTQALTTDATAEPITALDTV